MQDLRTAARWAAANWRQLAVVVSTLAALIGVTVVVSDDNGDGRPDRVVIQKPPPLPVTPKASEFDAPPGEAGQALPPSAEAPAAVDAQQEKAVDAGTYDTSGVLTGAAAQPAHAKCPTAMNGGPRSISDIGLGVVHVTVSRNVPGLADGNALCDFFRRVKASPTWTVDNEGNSWENVPLTRVPWTQVWFNRRSCSIENVGSTGRTGEGAAEWTEAQYREGARLMTRCFKLAGIPIRRGAVNGATGAILRTGVVTHQELGVKGGGHTDPGPFFDMNHYMTLMASFARPSITSADRSACAKVHAYRLRARARRRGDRHDHATKAGTAAFQRRLALIHARGLRCVDGRPLAR